MKGLRLGIWHYYVTIAEAYWKTAERQLELLGGKSVCGKSCSRMCCTQQGDSFFVKPFWPGDLEAIVEGVRRLDQRTLQQAIMFSRSEPSTCPLWKRDRTCSIYECRPIMCRIFGLPFYLLAYKDDQQPACSENPLPGHDAHDVIGGEQTMVASMDVTRLFGDALMLGLNEGEKKGIDMGAVVISVLNAEHARREKGENEQDVRDEP